MDTEMTTPKVFISHRHADAKIANVITKHLKEWGVEENNIFQSSDPLKTLPAGTTLKSEIYTKLQEINFLILLYTYDDADWSYCMWECGIAQGKSTAPNRTIVVQCTDDEPTVFKDEIRVRVTENNIMSFTNDFHRKAGFIPPLENQSHEIAFSPNTPEDVIETRSGRLFRELSEKIPSGRSSSQHLWDFIRLRLDARHVAKIKELGKSGERDTMLHIIRDNVELREPRFFGIGNSVDTAVRQFGYAGYQSDLHLKDLVQRWSEIDETGEQEWVSDVYETIRRAVTNTPPTAVSNTLRSVREGAEWWFYPAITRMRTFRDHSLEFDMYLIRVPENFRQLPDKTDILNIQSAEPGNA